MYPLPLLTLPPLLVLEAHLHNNYMPKVVNFNDGSDDEFEKPGVVNANAIQKQRESLPMYQSRLDVVHEVLSNDVTIIVGETGSGKSTQLPQAILESNANQNIVVSQPRRVAAISLAQRVSNESSTSLGQKVGYNVRFDAKVSKYTKIRYVTDGMLLREFILDPLLSRYTTVIVDEAHERTLTSDLVLGLLKKLLKVRNSRLKNEHDRFRVVVMSATLDAQRFADFFGDAPILYVPGRAYSVQRFYTRAPVANVVDAAVSTVIQINKSEPNSGDILVFLPGQDEIESACEVLREHKTAINVPQMIVLPLYAALPEKQQQQVFVPLENRMRPMRRKVILATNIAETSVTIPGVCFVVDSGLRKVRVHRTTLGLESLLPGPISQASAAQRTGRAGREQEGKCWRLYTENSYLKEMLPQTEPEISRVSLTYSTLLLKRIGVDDVLNFDWVDKPSKVAVRNALLNLLSLTAIDLKGNITEFGREMAKLPLEPSLSAVLLSAHAQSNTKVKNAVLDVAACLSVPDLLLNPSSNRRQTVNDNRQSFFPAAVQYGDLVLVKQIWDASKKIEKSDLKEWCYSIGVNHRALSRVQQVRTQLLGYLSVGVNGSKDADEDADENEMDSSAIDNKHQKKKKKLFDYDEEDNSKPLTSDEYEQLIKVFLKGYITNTAIALPDRRFQTTMTRQPISIHPGSSMFGQKPEAILYLEYVYTVRGYARLVAPVEVEWLRQTAPHLLARATTS